MINRYTELFLGLIVAGLVLIALGFIVMTTPGAFGTVVSLSGLYVVG